MATAPENDPFRILSNPPPLLTESEAEQVAGEHFGIQATARLLVSERDQNFHLKAADQREFVLKLANAAEDEAVTDFQNQALQHIAKVDPDFPVPRIVCTSTGVAQVILQHKGSRHIVRVLSYLPGVPWRTVGLPDGLAASLGNMLGRLARALRGYFHPGADHPLLWDMKRAAGLRELLPHIDDEDQKALVEGCLDRFEDQVLPALPGLRAQVIYNDLNPSNVLVNPDTPAQAVGIIDFGDMVYAPLITDVAVAAAYLTVDDGDPFSSVIGFLQAYQTEVPLEIEEVDLLFDLIATRFATTVAITSWRANRYPDNREYILRNNPQAARMLQRFSELDPESVRNRFRIACGLPVLRPAPAGRAGESDMMTRRKRLLGPAYRLFYERPVHVVRGQGVWLYDDEDRRYLDVYNNVAHVGHCHPHVVAAKDRQSRLLNTHTRYLHDNVLDYAERLTGLFPDGLDVAMFACTGSEANELALRIARACTGGTGMIVTRNAYHGNTQAIASLSPSYASHEGHGSFVRTIPAPDTYRGPYGTEPDAGTRFASHVQEAILDLKSQGIRLAGLLVDTIFSSDGLVTAPTGFLAEAVSLVREAGGVFIADEVQPGFGRTGHWQWGFERHGVVPDLVTLGKPMGNGYPLSGVVTSQGLITQFGEKTRYFNTFGGNPVACAAGLAVLDVLEHEKLRENAAHVGDYLKNKLSGMAERYPLIGDIRGSGLFIGIDLVTDRESREPASAQAHSMVNALRERGVLIGSTGPASNVLKLRPAMVFSRANADFLLDKLDQCFAEEV